MQWSGYSIQYPYKSPKNINTHFLCPNFYCMNIKVLLAPKTVSITLRPYPYSFVHNVLWSFHSIRFSLSLIFLDDPSHKKKEKKLEIMSPETTRVSLESTVEIKPYSSSSGTTLKKLYSMQIKKEKKTKVVFSKNEKEKTWTSRGFKLMIKSVILNQCYYSAGTTAVAAAAAATTAAAGGKDRRHLNGQSIRQHPYPRT